MLRWSVAIFVAVLTAVGAWLLVLNPETVRVQLTPARAIERSLAEILVAAFGLGAGVVALLASTRGIGHRFARWQRQRRSTREARDAATTAHARSLVWAGAYDQARAELGVDVDRIPSNPERVELAAESYLGDGDLAAARLVLERALAQVGPQPRLLDLLSTTAERGGDVAGAITTLEQLRPSLGSTPRLARRLRDLYVTAERFDDALAVQSDLLLDLRRGPALAIEERVLVGLRYVLACRDPEPGRAARRLSALVRQAPDFVPAAVAAGDRWQTIGRTFFARRIWERSVLRLPAQPLLDRLEDLHIAANRGDQTARLYQRLRAAHPTHPLVWLRSLRHAVTAGNVDAAAEILQHLPTAIATLPAVELFGTLLRHPPGTSADGWDVVRVTAQRLSATLPHACTACQAGSPTWLDRCDRCGTWGSIDLRTTAAAAVVGTVTPASPSEIEAVDAES